MSIYDKSSLVLIPSGTKTGKVYSQKPVSGDGDFTFTRSSAATRVNASGNIEKETQNLLTYSNDFNGWFYSTGSSATGGQAGYDGSNDAWLLNDSGVAAPTYATYQNFSTTGVMTMSLYAKASSRDVVVFDITGTGGAQAEFNLTSGTLVASSGAIDTHIEAVGAAGWYRCSVTCNATSAIYVRIGAGGAGTIYLQDVQVEYGLVARDYIETTTTAVEGGITDNVPRLDYTDSSCPALLLEPQRTNSLEFSEYFEGSYWISTRLDLSIDSSNSPEGVSNAYNFVPTATSGTHYIYDATSVTSGQDQTFSVYAKANGYDYFSIRFNTNNAVFGNDEIVFNLNDGSIESQDADITNSSIESVGNDWYRVSATRESLASSSGFILIRIFSNATTDSFTGDGTSGILFYGAQWEQDASYPTSYIPTYGSSVTRVDEVCRKENATDLIGQTEGSFFYEFEMGLNNTIGTPVCISEYGSTTNFILVYQLQSNLLSFRIRKNGVDQLNISCATLTKGKHKFAFAYKENDCVFYVDGVQIGTNTDCEIPENLNRLSLVDVGVGINKVDSAVNQSLLFKTRLSNEELAALTTI